MEHVIFFFFLIYFVTFRSQEIRRMVLCASYLSNNLFIRSKYESSRIKLALRGGGGDSR